MNILRKVAQFSLKNESMLNPMFKRLGGSLYEPDYLDAMKPKVPIYDTLNIQLRGYDFPILENYQRFLHNLIKNMDINVEECWGIPHQEIQVTVYKPKSEAIQNQVQLKTYQRTVQITDVPAYQLAVLLRAVEASTPSGVSIEVVPHEEYHEEIRYVPDTELKTLKQQLDDMGGPLLKKK